MPVSLPGWEVGVSASYCTISFSFEAVRDEYLSRTQRATQRAAILSFLQMEVYGKPYVRHIYIYIYTYIYIYRRGRNETCQCGAHSGSPQWNICIWKGYNYENMHVSHLEMPCVVSYVHHQTKMMVAVYATEMLDRQLQIDECVQTVWRVCISLNNRSCMDWHWSYVGLGGGVRLYTTTANVLC